MKIRILSFLLAAVLCVSLLPVTALAATGVEGYTVTLVPNLEGLEPVVFSAAEQGEIPFWTETFDEEYDECTFYWYSQEHPVLCFHFNGTYYPDDWCWEMEDDEALRFDGWDAQGDLALVTPDTQLNARWTPQRESAFEYELTPHAIRLQPGLTEVELNMSYGESDRFAYAYNEESNEYTAVQCYYFRFFAGELQSADGRTIPFYLDRDKNGDPNWFYRDCLEFLEDASDYVDRAGISIYVSPADCEAAGAGTFTGRLRMEEMIDDEMKHVGWNSIPVTLTLRAGAPALDSYTVRLTPGEGTGEPLSFSSADQASIPTGYGNAGNCEFYYEEGSGALCFRLDEDWCPGTFAAPEGWSFCCWEQTGYVELAQELTEVAAQWHVRRDRPVSSFALWPESIELTGVENEVELVMSELVKGRHGIDPYDPSEGDIPTGGLAVEFFAGELSSGQGSIPFRTEMVITEEYKEFRGSGTKFDRRGELQLLRIVLDKDAFISAAPGVYTGVLSYAPYWLEADHISRMENTSSASDDDLAIPLTLTVNAPSVGAPGAGDGDGAADPLPPEDACPLQTFTDLDPAAWYHDGVHFVLENGHQPRHDRDDPLPPGGRAGDHGRESLRRRGGRPVVHRRGALGVGEQARGGVRRRQLPSRRQHHPRAACGDPLPLRPKQGAGF